MCRTAGLAPRFLAGSAPCALGYILPPLRGFMITQASGSQRLCVGPPSVAPPGLYDNARRPVPAAPPGLHDNAGVGVPVRFSSFQRRVPSAAPPGLSVPGGIGPQRLRAGLRSAAPSGAGAGSSRGLSCTAGLASCFLAELLPRFLAGLVPWCIGFRPFTRFPNSGWVRVFLRAEEDVRRAIRLLERSFSLAAAQRARRGSA